MSYTHYKLDSAGMSWSLINDKDVPELMAQGVDVRTADDIMAMGPIDSSNEHTVYFPEQVDLIVDELEQELAMRIKRKSRSPIYSGCEPAMNIFLKRHPELVRESWRSVRLARESIDKFSNYFKRLNSALYRLLAPARERWKVITLTHDRTSIYEDVVISMTMMGDLKIKMTDNKDKQLVRDCIRTFKTHKWMKGKPAPKGSEHLNTIFECLLNGKHFSP